MRSKGKKYKPNNSRYLKDQGFVPWNRKVSKTKKIIVHMFRSILGHAGYQYTCCNTEFSNVRAVQKIIAKSIVLAN